MNFTLKDFMDLVNSGGVAALSLVVYVELRAVRPELRDIRDALIRLAQAASPSSPPAIPPHS